MFGPVGSGLMWSELAKTRAETLRADAGPRTRRPESSPGPLRRAVGRRFIGAGERLLKRGSRAREIRIRGGA